MKRFSQLFLVALLSGATTLGAYKLLFDTNGLLSSNKSPITTLSANSYTKKVGLSPEVLDFTEAAEKTIHTVVHVKNVSLKR
jgi:serine protease Do